MDAGLGIKGLSAHYPHKKLHNIVLFPEFTLTIGSKYAVIFYFLGDFISG